MRKRMLLSAAAGMAALTVHVSVTAAQTRTNLDIYVVDVEGGNATLFVSPSGESLLIDTGWIGTQESVRDAERVATAAKDAGLTQIDHLITTHWHGDHFGGMAELAKRIPIGHFIDHGPTMQPQPDSGEFLAKVYPELRAKGKHTVAKPGDIIPIAGLDWRIVTSAGAVLKTPLPGARAANPYCANFKPQPEDKSENTQSVGSVVTFGKFRVVHLGDLSGNKEFELMCPNNPIGPVDLFIVSHHGGADANTEVLMHAIHPRVAILNNGTRKGGESDALRRIYSSPGLENLWQIHFSLFSGQEYTVPGMFIANLTDEVSATMPVAPIAQSQVGPGTPPAPAHNGPAHWIKVSAKEDGTFTVTNARNKFSKTYVPKPGQD
jgi:competence protein ComEC